MSSGIHQYAMLHLFIGILKSVVVKVVFVLYY